ncbi:MAG: enoyl-CoA hydratase/isomerase family protein [archaeon]|nr:MAG: enoyl-CoA hydratase/isomerase family protein [archaeon]
MSVDYQTVKTEVRNGVQWISLNRPDKLNAFNEQMGTDLMEALKEGEKSAEARCLVLTGEGRAFSVGEDLNTNRAAYDSGKPMLLGEVLKRKYNPIVQRMRKMEKPIVAGINGVAAGAGLGLALACDLRVASEKATFHEAFIKVGLAPDSGTSFWLTRILGLAKAMEVGLLGEPIDSKVAMNLGLVNWVFPEDKFVEELGRIAERLARGPTRALGLTKRALNRAIVVDMDSALEYETYLQDVAGRTRDHVEGVKAFFEKREPSFSGQ